jgi:hypothetical protein
MQINPLSFKPQRTAKEAMRRKTSQIMRFTNGLAALRRPQGGHRHEGVLGKPLAFGSAITTWGHVEQLQTLGITHVINLRQSEARQENPTVQEPVAAIPGRQKKPPALVLSADTPGEPCANPGPKSL